MGLFGGFFKKEVHEKQAVKTFLDFFDEIEAHWDKIFEMLNGLAGPDKYVIENDNAMQELIVASLYLNSLCISRLFPDRSLFLHRLILKEVAEKYGQPAADSVVAYQKEWKAMIEEGYRSNTVESISWIYLRHCGLKESKSMLPKLSGMSESPLLHMALNDLIMNFGQGYWKMVSEKIKLVY